MYLQECFLEDIFSGSAVAEEANEKMDSFAGRAHELGETAPITEAIIGQQLFIGNRGDDRRRIERPAPGKLPPLLTLSGLSSLPESDRLFCCLGRTFMYY